MARIVIDAGHGGRDYGAVYEGRREKDDNLRLAMLVGDILKQNGVDVVYTRTSDVYNTPLEKARMGNEAGADYFVSIHRNAFPTPNTVSGVETLVYNDSGVKAEMARNINSNLEQLGFVNLGVKERPDLAVLRRTQIPAPLVEAGFIDSNIDNELLDRNYDAVARAIADGILETIQPEVPYYKVQVGLFRNENNANRLLEQLVSEGFPAYINYADGYYKVLVGAFQDLAQARDQEQRLRDYGYETVVVR